MGVHTLKRLIITGTRMILCLSLSMMWPSLLRAEDATVLGLAEAINYALASNPALRAAALRLQALESEAEQASVLPNPEIELEAENIAGTGEFSGTDAAEYTVMLTQPVQLGGKRRWKKRVAAAQSRLAELVYESARQDLVKDVRIAFVGVLESQERLGLVDELVKVSEGLVDATARRVKSGAASTLEQAKAEIECATLLTRQNRAVHALAGARRQLATLLGVTESKLKPVEGDLYRTTPPADMKAFLSGLHKNPDWQQLWVNGQALETSVALADSERVGELALGVGWRRDEGAGSDAYLFAAGMPLPLFDRGQGTRRAARKARAAGDAERRSAELELESQLATVFSEVQQAHALVHSINETVMPAATKAFDISRDGYLQGRFGHLDLLDAQRTLFEVNESYIDSLSAYHQAVAELERLTGEGSMERTNHEQE